MKLRLLTLAHCFLFICVQLQAKDNLSLNISEFVTGISTNSIKVKSHQLMYMNKLVKTESFNCGFGLGYSLNTIFNQKYSNHFQNQSMDQDYLTSTYPVGEIFVASRLGEFNLKLKYQIEGIKNYNPIDDYLLPNQLCQANDLLNLSGIYLDIGLTF